MKDREIEVSWNIDLLGSLLLSTATVNVSLTNLFATLSWLIESSSIYHAIGGIRLKWPLFKQRFDATYATKIYATNRQSKFLHFSWSISWLNYFLRVLLELQNSELHHVSIRRAGVPVHCFILKLNIFHDHCHQEKLLFLLCKSEVLASGYLSSIENAILDGEKILLHFFAKPAVS